MTCTPGNTDALRWLSLVLTADLRPSSFPLSLSHPPVIKHPSDKLVRTMFPSSRAMLLTGFTALRPSVDAIDHHYMHTTDPQLSSLNHLTK